MYIQGIRGKQQLRWCACGDHILEVVGTHYYDPEGNPAELEYSHRPLCPVCEDKERRGDTTGASLGELRRSTAAA